MKQLVMLKGIMLAAAIGIAARQMSQLPGLSVLGAMVLAIIAGMLLRGILRTRILTVQAGVSFTAKYLLQIGVALMGLRLNLQDIIAAGWQAVVLDLTVIVFTIGLIHLLGKRYFVRQELTTLIAVGTGVCGAAAIGAVAPMIRAKDEDVAIAVAIIALLGTAFSISYIVLLPILGLSPYAFGTFVGSTLHEVAHVVAASDPGGAVSSETAILVKLGRVAMVIPVAVFFGWFYKCRSGQQGKLDMFTVPWFLIGFLVCAALNTYHILNETIISFLLLTSAFLLTMAMAAMGINVNWQSFKRVGKNPVLVCFLGSMLLSFFGWGIIWLLEI